MSVLICRILTKSDVCFRAYYTAYYVFGRRRGRDFRTSETAATAPADECAGARGQPLAVAGANA